MAEKNERLPKDDSFDPFAALDLDALDDDFGFDGMVGDHRNKNRPFLDFSREFKKGVAAQLTPKNLIKRSLFASLPEGYRRLSQVKDNASRQWAYSRHAVAQEATPEILGLLRRTEEVIPRIRNRIPNKIYDRIQKRIEKGRQGFEDELRWRQNVSAEKRQVAQDEDDLALAIAELGQQQLEAAADTENAEQQRDTRRRVERGIRDHVQQVQFAQLTNRLAGIDESLQRQTAYQDQILYRYHKKSLELQYRSYFALRDLRTLAQERNKTSVAGYRVLAHNTALPDIQKVNLGVRELQVGFRQQMIRSAAQGIATGMPDFLSSFYPQMAKNIQSAVIDGVRRASGMAQGAGALDGMGMSKAGLGGSFLGGAVGNGLRDMLVGQAGTRLRPLMRRLSNRTGGYDRDVNYFLNNLPSFIQDYTNDINQSQGWFGLKGLLQNAVRRTVPSYYLRDEVKDGSFQTIANASSFNQLTQRSIVEIIPGYLSRMLQEIRMLRTGDESVEREVYDITAGRFTGFSTARRNLMDRILTVGDRRAVQSGLDDAMLAYDQDGKLSEDARKALRQRLVRDAATNSRFDPERYANAGTYDGAVSEEVRDELASFFQGRFTFDRDGKLEGTVANRATRDDLSTALIQLRNVVPNPRERMEELAGLGTQEIMRNLGILTSVAGTNRVDYQKVWQLYDDYLNPTQPPEDTTGPFGGPPPTPTDDQGNPLDPMAQFQREAAQGLGQVKDRLGNTVRQRFDNTDSLTERLQGRRRSLAERAASVSRRLKETPTVWEAFAKEHLNRSEFERVRSLVNQKGQSWKAALRGVMGPERYMDALDQTQQSMARQRQQTTGSPVGRGLASLRDQAQEQLGGLKQAQADMTQRVKETIVDTYTPTKDYPVLEASGIEQGEYIDSNTQRVIRSVADITGEVVDRFGNVRLTAQQFMDGLFDFDGKPLVRRGMAAASQLLSRGRSGVVEGLRNNQALRFLNQRRGDLRQLGRRALDFVTGLKDLYMPGEESPRLLANGIRRGEYIDQTTQKVIKSFRDITGTVVDRAGNVVVLGDNLTQLRDAAGTTFDRLREGAGRLRNGVVRAAGRYGEWSQRHLTRMSQIGSKLLKPFRGLWNRAGEVLLQPNDIKSTSEGLLYGIYNVLRSRLPGETLREGSWQQILKERAEKKAEGDSTTGRAATTGTLLGSIGSGIKSLIERFRRQEDAIEEDDDGDTYIGGVDAGGDGKKGKGRGRSSRIKGNRWYHKVGRGVGKLTGTLGRVSMGALDLLGLGGVARGIGGALKPLAKGAGTLAKWGGRGLASAGRFLLPQAASLAGRGLLMGGTAIAGALSSPVIAGAAAVGAVGAAGYFAYRWFTGGKVDGLIKRYRYAQYGVDPDDKAQAKIIAQLEEWSDKATVMSGGENPALDASAINLKDLMDLFGLDEEDQEHAERLSAWLELRFKPVFLAHQKALQVLAPQVSINDVDDDLPESQGMRYLNTVDFTASNDSPYAVTASPFKDGELTASVGLIGELRAKAVARYEQAKQTYIQEAASTLGLTAAASTGAQRRRSRGQPIKPQISDSHVTATAIGASLMATVGSERVSRHIRQSRLVPESATLSGQLTSLEGIRFRAYGLGPLVYTWVGPLRQLEETLRTMVTFQANGEASFAGDVSTNLSRYAVMFGFNVNDEVATQRFLTWFETRFLSVYLSYLSAVRQINPTVAFDRVESTFDAAQKVTLGRAMMGAQSHYRDKTTGVWNLPATVFGDYEETDGHTQAQRDLDVLEREAGRMQLTTPSERLGGMTRRDNVVPFKRPTPKPPRQTDPVRQAQEKMDQLTGRDTLNVPGQAAPMYRQGGNLAAAGRSVSGLTEGNGGEWEGLPLPFQDGSYQAAWPTIKAGGEMSGVDPNLLATLIDVESDFVSSAKNPDSTAQGWMQFIDGTWNEMLKRYGAKYGLPPNASRNDPRASVLMGAEFLKENARTLQKKLGREPTDTDLYAAHFFGAGTAANFLGQDSNTIASRVFPAQAAANPRIFLKPGGQPRTIGEIYAHFDKLVADSRHTPPPVEATADPVTQPLAEYGLSQVAPGDTGGAVSFAQPTAPGVHPLQAAKTPLSEQVNRGSQVARPSLPTLSGPLRLPGSEPTTEDSAETTSADALVTQDRQRRQAAFTDRQQRVMQEQQLSGIGGMTELMKRSVEQQTEMVTYLKTMSETLEKLATDQQSRDNATSTNDTSVPSAKPASESYVPRNTPAPIKMRR